MKKSFLFKSVEEREIFYKFLNQNCSQRIFVFAPFMIAFMLFEFSKDLYRHVASINQSILFEIPLLNIRFGYHDSFALIELIVMMLSVGILVATVFYRRKKVSEKKFTLITNSYSVILLFVSFVATVVDCSTFKAVDYNLFFLIAMIVTTVLYVTPFVIIPEILFSAGMLLFLVEYLEWGSKYSPYKPYLIFILLTVCIGSISRFKYLLDTMRREEKIKKLQQEAERENQLKSLFLANMSHEIRTPMNAIIGMSELALDFNLNDEQKNKIRQIRSSGMTLVNIINDILDFTKIESGKLEICLVEYDLLKAVYDNITVAEVKCKDKPVELILEMDPAISKNYFGDDLRIGQILINLLGNAAKFTEKGYIILRIEKQKNESDTDWLKFSVIDSGCGIRQEDQSKLFNAFQQVDMNMNRSKGGTGLGLSISLKLVQLMGGTMGVRSEYGKGSCFYFSIPQKIVGQETCGQSYSKIFDAAETNSYHSELKNLPYKKLLCKEEYAPLFLEKIQGTEYVYPTAKVLIVDDNEVNLQVADGLLQKYEVHADCAISGYEALEKLERNQYDIVYLDHQMPGMDGVETLQKLKAYEKANGKRAGAVIALSANAVNGAREKFLDCGFDDFVAKPVQGKDFGESLAKWLEPSKRKPAEKTDGVLKEKEPFSVPEGFVRPDENLIDMEQGVLFSGSFEGWVKAAELFKKSVDSKVEQIDSFLNSEDFKNYTILVHALKSSSKIIGALQLSELAKELEQLGNLQQEKNDAERKAVILEKNELLKKMLSELKVELFKMNAEKKSDDGDELSEQEVLDLLAKIKELAEQNNLNEIEEVFKKLKSAKVPGSYEEKISRIADAIDNIDFEEIINTLDLCN